MFPGMNNPGSVNPGKRWPEGWVSSNGGIPASTPPYAFSHTPGVVSGIASGVSLGTPPSQAGQIKSTVNRTVSEEGQLPGYSEVPVGEDPTGKMLRLDISLKPGDFEEATENARRLLARMRIASELTDRERKHIDFCLTYADKFSHGAPGHLDYTLIAALVELLEDAYAGE